MPTNEIRDPARTLSRVAWAKSWLPEDTFATFARRNQQPVQEVLHRVCNMRAQLGLFKNAHIPPFEIAQAYLRDRAVVTG